MKECSVKREDTWSVIVAICTAYSSDFDSQGEYLPSESNASNNNNESENEEMFFKSQNTSLFSE